MTLLILSFGTVHSPNTFIDEIKSIPTSFLMASNEETFIKVLEFFYHQNFDHNNEDPHEKIRNLILDSVDKRLMSDVLYGVFLSGGIDSSILVAAASKVSPQELNTFSIVFKDKNFDERNFQELSLVCIKQLITKSKFIRMNYLIKLKNPLNLWIILV